MTRSGMDSDTLTFPKFTIVIPTFNREKKLSRAIKSVLDQDHGDFELVIVDDGSTDGTDELLATYKDSRIRVLHQPNSGPCVARNAGVAASNAEFITFLDSDDQAHPRWLANFAALIQQSDADLVSAGAEVVSPQGKTTMRTPQPGGAVLGAQPALFLCGAFAVRRRVFEQVGGYAEGLSYSENTDLRLRLAPLMDSGTVRVSHSDQPGVRVFLRENRYDPQQRYESAAELLKRNRERLAVEPRLLAIYESIAGVSASRIGEHREALRHLAAAVRSRPQQLKYSARLARALMLAARDFSRRA